MAMIVSGPLGIRTLELLDIKNSNNVYKILYYHNYDSMRILNKRTGMYMKSLPKSNNKLSLKESIKRAKKIRENLKTEIIEITEIKYEYNGIKFMIYEVYINGSYDISIHKYSDVTNQYWSNEIFQSTLILNTQWSGERTITHSWISKWALNSDQPRTNDSCIYIMTTPININSNEDHNDNGNPYVDGIGIIYEISYYNDYPKLEYQYPKNNLLLKVAIKFLKEKKDRYNIDRIIVRDNSVYRCCLPCCDNPHDNNPLNLIHFGLLHTLIYGMTWYTKHGFFPCDMSRNDKRVNKYEYDKSIKNYNIVHNTLIADTYMFKFMLKTYRKKMDNESAIKKITSYYIKYKNYTICDFFKVFVKNEKFNISCSEFYNFYEKFCKKLKIDDFFNKYFIMYI